MTLTKDLIAKPFVKFVAKTFEGNIWKETYVVAVGDESMENAPLGVMRGPYIVFQRVTLRTGRPGRPTMIFESWPAYAEVKEEVEALAAERLAKQERSMLTKLVRKPKSKPLVIKSAKRL